MFRGTTPTLVFTLPFEASIFTDAYVTLAQDGETVLEKELCDCSAEGNTLSVTLTQEGTLLLQCRCRVDIQIRGKLADGTTLASHTISTTVHRILKEGVI